MIIDTHCHFDMMPNPERYIQIAENEGRILIGMTNLPSHFPMGYCHVRNFRYIRLALGVHPQLASQAVREMSIFDELVDKTSYIGEVGLDFSPEFVSTKEKQLICFRHILGEIRDKKKILSVHSRKAEKEVILLLKEYNIKNAIFHWYSGPLSLVDEIMASGYYLSINEAMTKSESGKNIIDRVLPDKILTESDAPYNSICDIHNALCNIQIDELDVYKNFQTLLMSLY